MKKIRFLLSLVMATSMLLSISLPTYAAEVEEPNNNVIVMTEGYNPFEIGGNTKSIIGDDNRVIVTDKTSYPYSAIAYLSISYSCGCTSVGTGFMVSKNCMLTAGHCVVCSEHGKDASTITAYFGYKSSTSYLIKATATPSTAVIYHDPKFSGTEKNYDYGYVVFNTNVGNTTGWFGLAARSDSNLDGMNIAVAGYRYGTLYRCNGEITSVTSKRIKYDADTDENASGAPVYGTDSSYSNMVVAVHTAGTDLLNWKNSGWRITADFINELVALGYVSK